MGTVITSRNGKSGIPLFFKATASAIATPMNPPCEDIPPFHTANTSRVFWLKYAYS